MRKGVFTQRLDEEVMNRFKEYVKKKHNGRLRTVLGLEMEKAMREYLEREGYSDIDIHAHTHEPKSHKSKAKKASQGDRANNLIYANYNESDDNERKPGMEKLLDPNESGISPSEKTKRRIVRHLKRTGMLDAEGINENAVKRVIGMEAGYDSRTINKYFNILEDELLLPHIEYLNIRDSRKLW